jgi:RNA polymerase sigma-B factor
MNPTPSSIQPPIQTDPDELIRLHLPMAYRLAACYRGGAVPYADLVQTAELGLVKAAERFDCRSGISFRAFAAPMISIELGRALRESGRRSGDEDAAQRRIAGALGRGSRVRDLARLLAVDPDVMAEAMLRAASRESVTLNLPAPRRRGQLHGVSVTPAAA